MATAQVQLPRFSGKYPVGTVSFPLTDESRDDPLAISSPQKRRLLVQLFYPTTTQAAADFPVAPYGPAISLQLASQMFQSFGINGLDLSRLTTRVSEGSPVDYDATSSNGKLPLVFFSHGVNATKLVSNHASADLASHGYFVAAVDHPFDAPFVEFPGGEIVPMNPRLNTLHVPPGSEMINMLKEVLTVRVDDVDFLVKTMLSDSFSVPGLGKLKIDESKVGAFGHSLGGVMAAELMLRNNKVVAGVNLDGPFVGEINASSAPDLERPFMILKYPGHTFADDPSYPRFIEAQKKFKTPVFNVKGTGHISFCDLPLLLDVFGVDRAAIEQMGPPVGGIGSIAGDRMNKCLTSYVSAFFNKQLMGDDTGLLSKDTDEEFPEVVMSDS